MRHGLSGFVVCLPKGTESWTTGSYHMSHAGSRETIVIDSVIANQTGLLRLSIVMSIYSAFFLTWSFLKYIIDQIQ